MHSTVYSVHSTVYSVHDIAFNLKNTVQSWKLHQTMYSIQYTVYGTQYSIQYTFYSVQWMPWVILAIYIMSILSPSSCCSDLHWQSSFNEVFINGRQYYNEHKSPKTNFFHQSILYKITRLYTKGRFYNDIWGTKIILFPMGCNYAIPGPWIIHFSRDLTSAACSAWPSKGGNIYHVDKR